MAARKEVSVGLISFLDVMCCGFGAIILLVVILNANLVKTREEATKALRSQAQVVAQEANFARDELARSMAEAARVEAEIAQSTERAASLEARLRSLRDQAQNAQSRDQTAQTTIQTLQSQSTSLSEAVNILRSRTAQQWQGGQRPVGFTGDGQRQYLTGMKLGGERTLILLDSSASMLDETIVNILRWRNMPPELARTAPKWTRTLRVNQWLLANLRPGKQFQVYHFNAAAAPLIADTAGRWLSTDDRANLTAALDAANRLVPRAGTSLHRAFAVISQMRPPPDSVVIVTDGLPTIGGRDEPGRMISADERLQIFNDAIRSIPKTIPVNTILLPMEGDPTAAGAFWLLALMTQGSFLTPTRDWP